jgi:hypothetical protein
MPLARLRQSHFRTIDSVLPTLNFSTTPAPEKQLEPDSDHYALPTAHSTHHAELTTGSLKLPESRGVADLLLREADYTRSRRRRQSQLCQVRRPAGRIKGNLWNEGA